MLQNSQSNKFNKVIKQQYQPHAIKKTNIKVVYKTLKLQELWKTRKSKTTNEGNNDLQIIQSSRTTTFTKLIESPENFAKLTHP